MAAWRTLDDMPDVRGKRVLVRLDLNVPVKDGKVSDATRIERSAPTVTALMERGARVVLCSHFGRPKNGPDEANSLRQIIPALDAHFKTKVAFVPNCIGAEAEKDAAALKDGEVLLLENTRFHAGEEKNDPDFAKGLAASGDFYVDDAFSMAHRAHASNVGVAKLLPAYAGRSMAAELTALESVLGVPKRPVLAIVGGSKVSTKIGVLTHLLSKVDTLVIGGAMANTFVAAQGTPVGKSLEETDQHETALDILAKAKGAGCRILLPSDGVAAKELKANVPTRTVSFAEIAEDEMVLDIGAASLQSVKAAIANCATVLWNGPVGAFEIPPFGEASFAIAREVKELTKTGKLVSVAGGGDTVAALEAAEAADGFTYISTAGGAFLEWLEGKPLPGVVALVDAAARG